jgi:hypothetical protein
MAFIGTSGSRRSGSSRSRSRSPDAARHAAFARVGAPILEFPDSGTSGDASFASADVMASFFGASYVGIAGQRAAADAPPGSDAATKGSCAGSSKSNSSVGTSAPPSAPWAAPPSYFSSDAGEAYSEDPESAVAWPREGTRHALIPASPPSAVEWGSQPRHGQQDVPEPEGGAGRGSASEAGGRNADVEGVSDLGYGSRGSRETLPSYLWPLTDHGRVLRSMDSFPGAPHATGGFRHSRDEEQTAVPGVVGPVDLSACLNRMVDAVNHLSALAESGPSGCPPPAPVSSCTCSLHSDVVPRRVV